ncbi:MAG: hypothetical protein ACK41P_06500, partial [Asticcacaulis sp.]
MRGQSELSAETAVHSDRLSAFVADPAKAEAAQKALLEDKSYQFVPLYLERVKPTAVPDWLLDILNTFNELGPFALILFWLIVGLLGVGLIFLLVQVIVSQTYQRPRLTSLSGKEP